MCHRQTQEVCADDDGKAARPGVPADFTLPVVTWCECERDDDDDDKCFFGSRFMHAPPVKKMTLRKLSPFFHHQKSSMDDYDNGHDVDG